MVFKGGHVAKFADWMCKDPKNGEILRADHFVEQVLEARLKGDKEARGIKVEEKEEDPKKKKKKVKNTEAIKLDDEVVKEYEEILARVRSHSFTRFQRLTFCSFNMPQQVITLWILHGVSMIGFFFYSSNVFQ